jgi:hypothetical protein
MEKERGFIFMFSLMLLLYILAEALTDMWVQFMPISFNFSTVYICVSRRLSFIVVKVISRCQ